MNSGLRAFFALALVFCAACASNKNFVAGPDDMLDAAEKNAVVSYVRNFVDVNKRLKLSAAERAFVRSSEPEFQAVYDAPKRGHLTISWQLTEDRRLIVGLEGDMLSESNRNIALQIVSARKPIYFKRTGEASADAPDAASAPDAKSP
jgi:hypothetical protein